MDQQTPPLKVRRTFASPADRVFDAWIDPSVARRWLFATPDGEIVRCEIDPRPGGAFIITDRRAGEDVEHRGNYLELDRPRHLALTFSVPKCSSVVTTVSVDVAPVAAGCELTLVHRDVLPEWASASEQGWRDLLASLEGLLQASGATR